MKGQPEDGVNRDTFRMAILLAHGHRIALGPLFLGTLFHRLDVLHESMAKSIGKYDVSTYLDTTFLQLWPYEHFPNFAPEPRVFEALSKKMAKDANGRPLLDEQSRPLHRPNQFLRTCRWWHTRAPRHLAFHFDRKDEFKFCPYVKSVEGVCGTNSYPFDDAMIGPCEINDYPFAAAVAWSIPRALLFYQDTEKADEKFGVCSYQPHRVARQLGYDLGTPKVLGMNNTDVDIAYAFMRFNNENKANLLPEAGTITVLAAGRKGQVTFSWKAYWKAELERFGLIDICMTRALPVISRGRRCSRRKLPESSTRRVPAGTSTLGTLFVTRIFL